MKVFLQNTFHGLMPCSDRDAECKKKLKIGQIYQCEIRHPRNYDFHKKYFALINCTWDCLTKEQKTFLKNRELLRKTLEVSAGYYEQIYSLQKREYQDIPVSISFSNMREEEFVELYEKVKRVILDFVLKGILSEEKFMEHLQYF